MLIWASEEPGSRVGSPGLGHGEGGRELCSQQGRVSTSNGYCDTVKITDLLNFYKNCSFPQLEVCVAHPLRNESFLSLAVFEARRKEHLQWLSAQKWKQCQYVATHLEPFSLLCKSLLSNARQWDAFRDSMSVYSLVSMPFSAENASPEESVTRPEESKEAGSVQLGHLRACNN